jgi:hypothetical protein
VSKDSWLPVKRTAIASSCPLQAIREILILLMLEREAVIGLHLYMESQAVPGTCTFTLHSWAEEGVTAVADGLAFQSVLSMITPSRMIIQTEAILLPEVEVVVVVVGDLR